MNGEDEERLREELVAVMRAMADRGLNRGTSGNASARLGEGLLVTPSGVPAQALTPEAMVRIDGAGRPAEGSARPSSEWRMHAGLYGRRPDAGAVVHCHSRHATILACTGRGIPPLHYMVAVGGGTSVPLAPYATFGTSELAQAVADTLAGGLACLMANHGQITLAPTLARALSIAEEVEEQAAVYWGALAVGGAVLLSEGQMAEVRGQFRGYGQRVKD